MSGLVIQTKEMTIFVVLNKMPLAVRIGAKLQIEIKHTTALTVRNSADEKI